MTQEPLESATFGHAQPPAEAIPVYNANTANEDTTQVTAAPVSSQAGVDTPSSGQASSSTSPDKNCACLVCLEIGIRNLTRRRPPFGCGFASCNWRTQNHKWAADHPVYYSRAHRVWHEKFHQLDPKDSQISFYCHVESCRFRSKRWPDLLRHTNAKHCNNPTKFPCSVIGCKYNGEGNGFIRYDKLKPHYKNMHQGQKVPGQAVRAIEPASASSRVEASASSSMDAQGD